MVHLVALQQITVDHITELGALADTGHARLSHKTSTGLEVDQGPVHFDIHGYGIGYIYGFPWSGHVTGIDISVSGVEAYTFSQFNFTVRQLLDYLDEPVRAAAIKILHGNDTVIGSSFDDSLFAYAGNDTIRGGQGADLVNGGTGNDRLFGLAGDDHVVGQAGNDLLAGGPGNDSLTGGAGNDRFLFDSALDPANNLDRITDFDPAHDKFLLSRSVFAGLAAGTTLAAANFHLGAADAPDQHILYDDATGLLAFDPDGNGPMEAVAFASVAAGTALTNAHFLLAA